MVCGISKRDLSRRAHLDVRDILEQMRSRLRTHVLEVDARRDAWTNEVQIAALSNALKALQNASFRQDLAEQQMPEPQVRRVTEVQPDASSIGAAYSRDDSVAAPVSAGGVACSRDVALVAAAPPAAVSTRVCSLSVI